MTREKVNPALLAQLEPHIDVLFDELNEDIFDNWVDSDSQKHREDLWAMKLAAEQLKGLIRGKIQKYQTDQLNDDLSFIKGGQG